MAWKVGPKGARPIPRVSVQEIGNAAGEPMYYAVIQVPMRAGDDVLDEMLIAVGEAVLAFEKTIPDHDWEADITGHYPLGYNPPDDAT